MQGFFYRFGGGNDQAIVCPSFYMSFFFNHFVFIGPGVKIHYCV